MRNPKSPSPHLWCPLAGLRHVLVLVFTVSPACTPLCLGHFQTTCGLFHTEPCSQVVERHPQKKIKALLQYLSQEGSASVASSEAPQDQPSATFPGHACDFRAGALPSFVAAQMERDSIMSERCSASRDCPVVQRGAVVVQKVSMGVDFSTVILFWFFFFIRLTKIPTQSPHRFWVLVPPFLCLVSCLWFLHRTSLSLLIRLWGA